MFPLPITTWIISGLIALTSLTGWYGYHEHDELVVYKQHIAVEVQAQTDKVEQEKKDAQTVTTNIVDAYAAALNRVQHDGSSGMLRVPNTPSPAYGTICTPDFVNAANETEIQLEYLKQWVEEQCRIGCQKP